MNKFGGFVRIWLVVSTAAAVALLIYILKQFAPTWVMIAFLSPLFAIPLLQTDEILAEIINWIKRGFEKNQESKT